ncbi:MAG TPA: hypothetical protein VKB68_11760 [Stellaceae bacterium]|nr:hypothetical protein [Stellaceae bacterium]
MTTLGERPTIQREASGGPEPRTRPDRAVADPERDRALLWSRVMQEARGRVRLLARRAFPWRYY